MNIASFKTIALSSVFALMTVTIAQTASAKEPRFITQAKQAAVAAVGKRKFKEITPNCANFAGSWTGICVDQIGESEPKDMVINQTSCTSIDIDNFEFDINGLHTVAAAPAQNSDWPVPYVVGISMRWNDAQTRLYSSYGINLAGLFAGASTQEIWLEGDTLRQKDTSSAVLDPMGGPSPVRLVMDDCTFQRQ